MILMKFNLITLGKISIVGTMAMLSLSLSCSLNKQNKNTMISAVAPTGTFGHDLAFLNKYQKTVVLSDSFGKSQLIIIPGWQARVMTSTANGNEGFSYGWINYKLIESGRKTAHINAYGGEERLWLGPEGGQFSIYFTKGVKQDFDNWQVPGELDTIGFDLVAKSQTKAGFAKRFSLVNYSGTIFDIKIERNIELLGRAAIENAMGITLPDSVKSVAYQTDNILTNNGLTEWTRDSGLLSVWMLSMLNPSPEVTIFIPYKENTELRTDKILNDDYFGKVPSERLIVDKGVIYFKADGKYRSKIGIPPNRALNYSGSYDGQHKALTLLWCDLPKDRTDYVNSKWEIQKDPFSGDVINAYNDGPVADGTQMGPFYELESSSPAANLSPGEKITHRQRIYHFEGSEEHLSLITAKIFGITLNEVKNKFK
jgi:hypothetical protein